MKLMTREILVDYRGVAITCEQTFYGCTICDFELHLDWMKENMQQNLAAAYENLKDPS